MAFKLVLGYLSMFGDSIMNGTVDFSDKTDVVKFVLEKRIKIVDLCHVSEEGKLKTLSFSASDRGRVEEVLEFGERVDGSSLFSFIEPGKSDIFIKPRFSRAFEHPFSRLPTLNVMCDYLDENGRPLEVSPKNVLTRAEEKLHSSSGITLKALAELEFYVIAKQDGTWSFPGAPDRNYHDSVPFTKFEDLRNDVLAILASLNIPTKYGHSEVGRIFGKDGILMEQQEIEFLPQGLADMAETIAITKWVIRNVAVRYGVSVSFIPKISLEHAGTGMHVHLCGLRNGRNVVARPDGGLSEDALMMIGGILKFASSLAAFGNPTPVSYLRFIARKESPMNICWSVRNRLALIRIPLWWSLEKKDKESEVCRETFEYRAPDSFANAYLLFAGLAVAAGYGLKHGKRMLETAEDLHIKGASDKGRKLKTLPRSCFEAAENLARDRQLYETDCVFPKGLIEKTIERLKGYKDKDMWDDLANKQADLEKAIAQYLHYG